MVLEEEIPKFAAWIGPALLWYLFAGSLVAVVAAALAWLTQSVLYGPLAAGDRDRAGELVAVELHPLAVLLDHRELAKLHALESGEARSARRADVTR